MKLPATRRTFQEAALTEAFKVTLGKPTGGHGPLFGKKQSRSDVAKRIRAMKKTKKKLAASHGLANQLDQKKKKLEKRLGGSQNKRWRVYARKVNQSKLHEWTVLSENVLDYVDFQELGPALKDSRIQQDNKGNVTAVSIPRSHTRNEGKILSFNWKTLDHEIKYSRNGAKNLQNEAAFCKAMATLKRYNAVSDNEGLQTTLENIVKDWPHVIFLTQDELSQSISEALSSAGVQSYDDRICNFMAEGILRTAHDAFTGRVKKIVDIAQLEPTVESKDAYLVFKDVVDRFYPTIDESEKSQYQVFADLYKALHEMHRIVDREGDEALKSEVASYLHDCELVLNRQAEPTLELAENIAVWLHNLVESNVDRADDSWSVSNDVHTTISGDHPDMAKMATVPNIPGRYKGDWGDELPVSDGKSYKSGEAEKMKNSWANVGGDSTAPNLRNPYIPEPFGQYKMKGEKSVVDDNDDFGTWQGKDTWPQLQNPVIPDGGMSPQNYKMKNDDLIFYK